MTPKTRNRPLRLEGASALTDPIVILTRFQETGKLFCPKCQQDLEPADFADNSRRATGKQLWCRKCKAAYDAELYRASPQRRAAITKNNVRRAADNSALVFAYLCHHPCVECGERDPVVLEFDHRNAPEKISSVTDLCRGGAWKWQRVLDEMLKCDVRCANCHRRRTAVQHGHFGWLGVQIVLPKREPAVGLEPTTPALRMRCSTAELRRHCSHCDHNINESCNQTATTAADDFTTCCVYVSYKNSFTTDRSITNRVLYP